MQFFALGLGVFCMLGCWYLAPMWMNRRDLPPGKSQSKCRKDINDPGNDPRGIARPSGSVKVIRLTNAGEFVDRCELTDALYELNWDRERPDGSFGVAVHPDAPSLPKLTVLYIHGWKHGYSNDDTDLTNFSELIAKLRHRHRGAKHVVGVYVGWDASAGLPGLLENASFWIKKTNADRIAQSGVVTKIVSSIGGVSRGAPGRTDQFIAIGHSFGARLLFSAVAQSLIYQAERAHPGHPNGTYGVVEGPADAIILLNPAFEASRYSAIDDVTRRDERFQFDQPPLLISVATDNDWATRRAFPLGQWLGRARSARELTTLGNYLPFVTHTLSRATASAEQFNDASLSEEFVSEGLCLARLARGCRSTVMPHNPFIVASTTKDVIDGHNGIWTEGFGGWLIGLITALEAQRDRTNKV
jgi:hypothetical protein